MSDSILKNMLIQDVIFVNINFFVIIKGGKKSDILRETQREVNDYFSVEYC